MYRQIGALSEGLSQQSICVFLRPALPCIARQAIAQQSAEKGECGSHKKTSMSVAKVKAL